MKRPIVIALATLLVVPAIVASGDYNNYNNNRSHGEAVATVLVTVNPNVTVGVIGSVVDAGTIQTGEFEAQIRFRVDANQQQLFIQVEATPLYKGDDPLDNTVEPIPLALSVPVIIAPTDAAPMDGLPNAIPLSVTGSGIGDFPSMMTASLRFESSQNNHFSQDVFVTVTWDQIDPEQPTGEYSGRVKLIVFLDGASQPPGPYDD